MACMFIRTAWGLSIQPVPRIENRYSPPSLRRTSPRCCRRTATANKAPVGLEFKRLRAARPSARYPQHSSSAPTGTASAATPAGRVAARLTASIFIQGQRTCRLIRRISGLRPAAPHPLRVRPPSRPRARIRPPAHPWRHAPHMHARTTWHARTHIRACARARARVHSTFTRARARAHKHIHTRTHIHARARTRSRALHTHAIRFSPTVGLGLCRSLYRLRLRA